MMNFFLLVILLVISSCSSIDNKDNKKTKIENFAKEKEDQLQKKNLSNNSFQSKCISSLNPLKIYLYFKDIGMCFLLEDNDEMAKIFFERSLEEKFLEESIGGLIYLALKKQDFNEALMLIKFAKNNKIIGDVLYYYDAYLSYLQGDYQSTIQLLTMIKNKNRFYYDSLSYLTYKALKIADKESFYREKMMLSSNETSLTIKLSEIYLK